MKFEIIIDVKGELTTKETIEAIKQCLDPCPYGFSIKEANGENHLNNDHLKQWSIDYFIILYMIHINKFFNATERLTLITLVIIGYIHRPSIILIIFKINRNR